MALELPKLPQTVYGLGAFERDQCLGRGDQAQSLLSHIVKLDKASPGLAVVTWRIVQLQKEQANVQVKLREHAPWRDSRSEKTKLEQELAQVKAALRDAFEFRGTYYRSALGSIAFGGDGQTRAQRMPDEIRKFLKLRVQAEEDVIFAESDLNEAEGHAHNQLQVVVSAYKDVRNWYLELERAFFGHLQRSLPAHTRELLDPYLGTDGLHVAHTLAKSATQGGGGYRRRMIYGM